MDDVLLRNQLAVRERPSRGMVVMRQSWRRLLFLHWRIDPGIIAATLPPGLRVHTFDGDAWLGIVPFFMLGVRPRFLPPVPGISSFLELNLRTYVTDEAGWPGVWFYSLDANQGLAVRVARSLFNLPYEHARMGAAVGADGTVDYRSHRRGAPLETASRFQYRPTGPIRTAEPGTLDFFLLERYLLYAWSPRSEKLYRGRVHHTPYPVQDAATPVYDAKMFGLSGFQEPVKPREHVAYSDGVDVSIYPLERVQR